MEKQDGSLFSRLIFFLTLILKFLPISADSYTSGLIGINWIINGQSTTNFTMSSSGMTSGKYFAFGLSQVKINNISLFYSNSIISTC
jgi:hypothetical protein